MKYSIVIPVSGGIERLDMLLASIERRCRRRHAEVIAVDDGCEEQDAGRLISLRKDGRLDILVEHGSRRGFAAAVNSGIRSSTADLIVVMHADVVAGPNTLGRLASRLEPSGPASVVSAVCCRAPSPAYVLAPELQYRLIESFSSPTTKVDERLVGMYGDFDAFCRTARITRPDLVYTQEGYIFAAMFTRETWAEVGEMEESFSGRGMADRLWVDRLYAIGGRMYVDRSTYCHHWGGDERPSCGEGLHYEDFKRDMLRETGRLP